MRFVKSILGIGALALLFSQAALAAPITKTLEENTRILPPAYIVAVRSEIPMFKKGTVVTLNEIGEIMSGTLAEDISLPYESGNLLNAAKTTSLPGYTPPPVFIPVPTPTPTPPIFIPYKDTDKSPQIRVLAFKGGTNIVFNEKGEVVRGTLTTEQMLCLNPVNRISVGRGEISFHPNGMVASCTLANDSYLRPVGWSQLLTDNFTERIACAGFVEFKGDKTVQLNDKGEVIKGTLNQDTKLMGIGKLSLLDEGVIKKTYEAGTMVEFNDKGIVVQATKK